MTRLEPRGASSPRRVALRGLSGRLEAELSSIRDAVDGLERAQALLDALAAADGREMPSPSSAARLSRAAARSRRSALPSNSRC